MKHTIKAGQVSPQSKTWLREHIETRGPEALRQGLVVLADALQVGLDVTLTTGADSHGNALEPVAQAIHDARTEYEDTNTGGEPWIDTPYPDPDSVINTVVVALCNRLQLDSGQVAGFVARCS